jgi:uncharacterized membrane protein YhaH (DUF805 family)
MQCPKCATEAPLYSSKCPSCGQDFQGIATAASYSQDSSDAQLGPDGLYIHSPSRGFGEAVSVCFKKYFTFSGRASRSEYWWFILFGFLVGIAASIVDVILFGLSAFNSGIVNSLTNLVFIIPTHAVAWRRLHDTNRSGWWIGGLWIAIVVLLGILFAAGEGGASRVIALASLVFLVWGVTIFVFTVKKGHPTANRFG